MLFLLYPLQTLVCEINYIIIINTCYSSQLPIIYGIYEVGHEPRYVGPNAVPYKMQIVCFDTPGMLGQVPYELRDALGAKSGSPLHLLETRLPHQGAVIDDDDVVIARGEECVPHVCAGGKIPSSSEAVDHDFCGILPVELGVVQGLTVGCV